MIAKLEFNLPEDRSDFLIAQRGGEYLSALLEIQNVVREHHKYGKKLKVAFEEIEAIIQEAKTDDIE